MFTRGVVVPPFGFKPIADYLIEIDALEPSVHRSANQQPGLSAEMSLGLANGDIAKKVLGYLPVIGTFMGVRRIKACQIDKTLQPKRLHVIRGIIEGCSIGVVLIPVDICVSIYSRLK